MISALSCCAGARWLGVLGLVVEAAVAFGGGGGVMGWKGSNCSSSGCCPEVSVMILAQACLRTSCLRVSAGPLGQAKMSSFCGSLNFDRSLRDLLLQTTSHLLLMCHLLRFKYL